jgi:hypothetical protein
MTRVHLTYFKRNGKYYSDAWYTTPHVPLYEIWEEVRQKLEAGLAPGLVERPGQPCEFIALVDVPNHPHRHPHIIGLGR